MSAPAETGVDKLLAELPLPTPICKMAPLRFDCYVGIAGFEARCVSATQELAVRGSKSAATVCVQYNDAEMAKANETHLRDLTQHLQCLAGGKPTSPLMHDNHRLQEEFGERLRTAIISTGVDLGNKDAHVGFDITVGSSRLLLEGLHALLNTNVNLTLVYSEASEYRPLFSEHLKYIQERRSAGALPPEFLTLGVDQVDVLRRIPGRNADARPTYLVAFPSFSCTRMEAVLEELSPSRVHWIFGIPHLVRNRWRIDAQKEYHASLMERAHRRCYVSTFDYRETLAALNGIFLKRRSQYSILIASLGSKLQKVGQVLFHLLRPEVGAVVSIPRKWEPDRFSSDKPREIYALQLGSCPNIRHQLIAAKSLKM